jgi:hypothetical protein
MAKRRSQLSSDDWIVRDWSFSPAMRQRLHEALEGSSNEGDIVGKLGEWIALYRHHAQPRLRTEHTRARADLSRLRRDLQKLAATKDALDPLAYWTISDQLREITYRQAALLEHEVDVEAAAAPLQGLFAQLAELEAALILVLEGAFLRRARHRPKEVWREFLIAHVVRELAKAEELSHRQFDDIVRLILEAAGARLQDYRPVLARARQQYACARHCEDEGGRSSEGSPRSVRQEFSRIDSLPTISDLPVTAVLKTPPRSV